MKGYNARSLYITVKQLGCSLIRETDANQNVFYVLLFFFNVFRSLWCMLPLSIASRTCCSNTQSILL